MAPQEGSEVAEEAPSGASQGIGLRLRAPGVVFYLVTAVAIAIAIDANSRQSFATFMLAALIWVALAIAWLLWFALRLLETDLRMPAAEWVRWILIPVVMGAVFLLTRTDTLFDARLALSRGAMDQLAHRFGASAELPQGWVGLYNVTESERTANGFRFVIDDSGLSRLGFAYSTDGEPRLTEENYSPLWAPATTESIGGGWWFWSETWD